MISYVCQKNMCTGCNACANICPRKAIDITYDSVGNINMQIDTVKCVNCNLCQKVCPTLNPPDFHLPQKAYAVWNKNKEIRNMAASGGMASSLYRLAVANDEIFCGVELNDELIANFKLGRTFEDIIKFRNSKYTFSFTNDIYTQIYELLKSNKNVLFIGLPCQVAGLKKFLKYKANTFGKLVCVDLVCHGTPPFNYLQEHANSISKKLNKKVNYCQFRDPRYGTSNFFLTFYSKPEDTTPLYHKNAKSNDLYQIGYHKAYIYKENCYDCKYATNNRVSDITISDYRWKEIDNNRKEISNVLINTEIGAEYFDKLIKLGEIEYKEYPVSIALSLDKQLNHPSQRSEIRNKFLKSYQLTNNYDKASKIAFRKERNIRTVNAILHTDKIREVSKKFLKTIIPRKFINKIKGSI